MPHYPEPPSDSWLDITRQAVAEHPLSTAELIDLVNLSWQAIFDSKFGPSEFQIGKDLFPSPQVLSFFLHEFLALEVAKRYPAIWRRDESAFEKDLVFMPDSLYSVEIKASSSARQVYGNRSYAQPSDPKKSKDGYYLTINFSKPTATDVGQIKIIRFGWLDRSDWIPQRSSSGQQARLRPVAYQYKLLTLFPADQETLRLQ